MSLYDEVFARSMRDPEGFWGAAAEDIYWERRWDRVLDDSRKPFYRWFVGAAYTGETGDGGSAGGSNRLAREATADSLLVLNSDTYPAPDLLAELLASSTTRWSESPRPGRFPSSTRRRST